MAFNNAGGLFIAVSPVKTSHFCIKIKVAGNLCSIYKAKLASPVPVTIATAFTPPVHAIVEAGAPATGKEIGLIQVQSEIRFLTNLISITIKIIPVIKIQFLLRREGPVFLFKR